MWVSSEHDETPESLHRTQSQLHTRLMLYIHISVIYIYICISIYLSVYRSIYLSICIYTNHIHIHIFPSRTAICIYIYIYIIHIQYAHIHIYTYISYIHRTYIHACTYARIKAYSLACRRRLFLCRRARRKRRNGTGHQRKMALAKRRPWFIMSTPVFLEEALNEAWSDATSDRWRPRPLDSWLCARRLSEAGFSRRAGPAAKNPQLLRVFAGSHQPDRMRFDLRMQSFVKHRAQAHIAIPFCTTL